MRRIHWSGVSGSKALGLAVASYGAALIAMVTSVILTHAMTPEAFGSYRYVLAVVGLGAIVANFGLPYSAARLLTRQTGVAQSRTVASSLQLLLAALMLAGSLLGIAAILAFRLIDAAPLLLVAAGLLWTIGVQRHFMYTLRGSGRNREIAVQTLLPPILIMSMATAWMVISPTVYLAWMLVATAVAYLVTHVWTATRLSVWRQRHLAPERASMRAEQRTTGIPIYKGALVSVGVGEFVIVLGGAHIGGQAFGEFALALSLAAPVATLPTVIGMVQFRKFGQQRVMPRAMLISTSVKSAGLGSLGLVVGWLAFPWVFPEEFDQARRIFPVLAVGYLAHGLADYLNQFLQAQGAGHRLKRASYIVGCATFVVGLFSIPALGTWGLTATRIATSGTYVFSMLYMTRRWNASDAEKN